MSGWFYLPRLESAHFCLLCHSQSPAQQRPPPASRPLSQLPCLLPRIHCQHGRQSDFFLTYRSQTPLFSLIRCLPRALRIKSKFPVQVFLLRPPHTSRASLLDTNPDSTSGMLTSSIAQEYRGLSHARLSQMPHFRGKEKFRVPYSLGDWSACSELPTLL